MWAFWCLFGLFVVSTSIRSTYEALKRNGKVDAENRPLFAFIALTMAVLWLSWFSMCSIDPNRLQLPGFVKWSGLGITIIGWCLALGALVQLRGVEDIDHLVTRGLFTRLRHPMYTGFMFWILGWSLFHGAGISLIAGVFGIGNVVYWRRVEETALETRFGDPYRVYRAQTWF